MTLGQAGEVQKFHARSGRKSAEVCLQAIEFAGKSARRRRLGAHWEVHVFRAQARAGVMSAGSKLLELSLEYGRLSSAHAEQNWVDAQADGSLSRPCLAFVDYPQPTFIYGRRGGDDAERRERARMIGADLRQRRSGGGAVYAGPWLLGFHLALPRTNRVAGLDVIASQRWFGAALCAALSAATVAASVVRTECIAAQTQRARAAQLDWACFAGWSHGEILDHHGRKLVGTCQWRGRWGLVLSGGMLLGPTPCEEFEFIHHGARPPQSQLRDWLSSGPGPTRQAGAWRADIEHHLWRELVARVGADVSQE